MIVSAITALSIKLILLYSVYYKRLNLWFYKFCMFIFYYNIRNNPLIFMSVHKSIQFLILLEFVISIFYYYVKLYTI